jgi:putative DNA-binding protein
MRTLAETQRRFRNMVIQSDADAIAELRPLLVGGNAPEKRLSIHQRNYHKTLIDALLVKFPATGWLVGTAFLTQAAERFVCERPPAAPCIAEYGAEFPAYLSQQPGTELALYLKDFVELEWCVGQVAIALDRPPVTAEEFSGIDPNVLPNTFLTLQPGLHFLQARWPVDELMTLYLTETAPDQFELAASNVRIEVRGARGQFHFSRLDKAEFTFRKSIAGGYSIGDAAEFAMDSSADFDPGQALAALIAAGFITCISREHE